MWIIGTPLLRAQISATPAQLTWLDYLAIPVWLVGFFFEAVGDWQLAQFKANPANKGKVLNTGVWRYTRHPNYFGDAAQWWAYYLIALAAGGWWTIFSPVLMTLLLMRVSGVTLLEKTLKDPKPGYKEYVENTSEFIPWFPKKQSGRFKMKIAKAISIIGLLAMTVVLIYGFTRGDFRTEGAWITSRIRGGSSRWWICTPALRFIRSGSPIASARLPSRCYGSC